MSTAPPNDPRVLAARIEAEIAPRIAGTVTDGIDRLGQVLCYAGAVVRGEFAQDDAMPTRVRDACRLLLPSVADAQQKIAAVARLGTGVEQMLTWQGSPLVLTDTVNTLAETLSAGQRVTDMHTIRSWYDAASERHRAVMHHRDTLAWLLVRSVARHQAPAILSDPYLEQHAYEWDLLVFAMAEAAMEAREWVPRSARLLDGSLPETVRAELERVVAELGRRLVLISLLAASEMPTVEDWPSDIRLVLPYVRRAGEILLCATHVTDSNGALQLAEAADLMHSFDVPEVAVWCALNDLSVQAADGDEDIPATDTFFDRPPEQVLFEDSSGDIFGELPPARQDPTPVQEYRPAWEDLDDRTLGYPEEAIVEEAGFIPSDAPPIIPQSHGPSETRRRRTRG